MESYKTVYEYNGKVYCSEDAIDEAICEKIGGNYNNIDPMDTAEFEEEWQSVEVIRIPMDVAWRQVVEYCQHGK